jgi:hypothetical protein
LLCTLRVREGPCGLHREGGPVPYMTGWQHHWGPAGARATAGAAVGRQHGAGDWGGVGLAGGRGQREGTFRNIVKSTATCGMDRLDSGCTDTLLSFLPTVDVVGLRKCTRAWRVATGAPQFWRAACVQDWLLEEADLGGFRIAPPLPSTPFPRHPCSSGRVWRMRFQRPYLACVVWRGGWWPVAECHAGPAFQLHAVAEPDHTMN